eukprot:CAMPEP_0198303062 /NCGR_PEP_ID=MMETSP1449-20131203/56693_1 /TAXON_ID=420275 /ORGANISM="Attheya septentrionalis, Strain CCMP2084" /LENGTH=369 /DNA_ID=CAMNT_0044005547 /DNA_START=576 /DNA_END=1686 /DNA_ORIENTATION=-
MSNPLLGNRISLISKKNIRYEGILYSINESDATVALQDVKSFGTEGREKTDPSTAFVPPQDAQHAFLVFRGQDIKDLHVHEAATPASEPALPEDPAIISSTLPPDLEAKKKQQETQRAEKGVFDDDVPIPKPHPSNQSSRAQKQKIQGGASIKKPQEQRVNQSGERRPRKKTDNQVGTGASLLNRKARGVVDGSVPTPKDDFDFESNLAEFEKARIGNDESDEDSDYDDEEEDDMDGGPASNAYSKDDFFDSISCDAIDKRDGVDNRLRGAAERNLNTETFGAVALETEDEEAEEVVEAEDEVAVAGGAVEKAAEEAMRAPQREKIIDGKKLEIQSDRQLPRLLQAAANSQFRLRAILQAGVSIHNVET